MRARRGGGPVLLLTNHLANRLLVPWLRSPLGARLGRSLAVLEYEGRRTGATHRLVTGYRRDGATVVIRVGMPERKTWWRGFRSPQPLRLRLAGEDHRAVARVVEGDRVEVVAELRPEA